MAAPLPTTSAAPASADSRRLLATALVVLGIVGVPLAVAVGLSWVEMPWSTSDGRATPEWVTLPQLRATTSDGTVVRARVALDVPSTLLKSTIQRNTQQVGLLLELSVAARSRAELGGTDGIRGLGDDMRSRLNEYLGVDPGDPGVRSVAIQDLLIKQK